jgi:hypothetical protein
VFEHFELDADANYRKGDRMISKAFVRIPVSTARKLQGWTVDDSRVKQDTVETFVLMMRTNK